MKFKFIIISAFLFLSCNDTSLEYIPTDLVNEARIPVNLYINKSINDKNDLFRSITSKVSSDNGWKLVIEPINDYFSFTITTNSVFPYSCNRSLFFENKNNENEYIQWSMFLVFDDFHHFKWLPISEKVALYNDNGIVKEETLTIWHQNSYFKDEYIIEN